MRTHYRILVQGLILVSLLSVTSVTAQRKDNRRINTVKTERNHHQSKRVGSEKYQHKRYRTQPIRRAPQYRYPRHRRVVRTLHRNHVRMVFRGLTYFYYAGVYYSSYGDQYVVVIPPTGFRIVSLPMGHVRVVFGPRVYYYHSGIYYIETTDGTGKEEYEVTSPELGTVLSELSEDAKPIIIDGKELLEYNNVLYKEITNDEGQIAFEVVYTNQEK